jgi:hypothetical protein
LPTDTENQQKVIFLTERTGTAMTTNSGQHYTDGEINILATLAADPALTLRVTLATDQSTPADVLRGLARDSDADVQLCVARNNSTPADALQWLLDDAVGRVRTLDKQGLLDNAVGRVSYPDNIFLRKIQDAIAGNASTGDQTLIQLVSTCGVDIKEKVAHNLLKRIAVRKYDQRSLEYAQNTDIDRSKNNRAPAGDDVDDVATK